MAWRGLRDKTGAERDRSFAPEGIRSTREHGTPDAHGYNELPPGGTGHAISIGGMPNARLSMFICGSILMQGAPGRSFAGARASRCHPMGVMTADSSNRPDQAGLSGDHRSAKHIFADAFEPKGSEGPDVMAGPRVGQNIRPRTGSRRGAGNAWPAAESHSLGLLVYYRGQRRRTALHRDNIESNPPTSFCRLARAMKLCPLRQSPHRKRTAIPRRYAWHRGAGSTAVRHCRRGQTIPGSVRGLPELAAPPRPSR